MMQIARQCNKSLPEMESCNLEFFNLAYHYDLQSP